MIEIDVHDGEIHVGYSPGRGDAVCVRSGEFSFTLTQLLILERLGRGLGLRGVASDMGLSWHTVKNTLNDMRITNNYSTTRELLRVAYEAELLTPICLAAIESIADGKTS